MFLTRRRAWLLCLSASAVLLGGAVERLSRPARVSAAQQVGDAGQLDPDAACGRCHAAIVESYRRTAMANGSGDAASGLLPGTLQDGASGVSYRVGLQGGVPTMTFQRAATDSRGGVSGQQRMEYFIGSGHRGRTYLYQQDGLWFELPINYYTRRAVWDLSPNYGGRASMPPALPVDPNCLHCHSTGVAASLPQARNAFASAPFRQGGIGCSACHGDGAAHSVNPRGAHVVNPAKLDPARRDSACIQCHLEGDAVVYRPGRSLAAFQPGDDLRETAAYFVRASRAGGGARATSQYEAMLQSACKQASGDRLTCTTCHDPHSTPTAATRVVWYRARCLACHTAPTFSAAAHHPRQQDCASCHMPTRQTSDISHEQVTDHNIQAHPGSRDMPAPRAAASDTLRAVGGFGGTDRELGLAYAGVALRGDRAAATRALQLLLPLEASADEQVALHLGFLLQLSGNPARAEALYRRVLQLHPAESTALGNLAVLQVSQGKLADATALLRTAVENDGSGSAAAANLAVLLCRQGQAADAAAVVTRARRFNPDDATLRSFSRGGCAASR